MSSSEPLHSVAVKLLVKCVPIINKGFDAKTGRFHTRSLFSAGPDHDYWIRYNQGMSYALAVLFVTDHRNNPYYKDKTIFDIALKGCDCLVLMQNPDGTVDNIECGYNLGTCYLDWTLYHWLSALELLKNDLDKERVRLWENGIRKTLEGLAARTKGFLDKGKINTGYNHFLWYLVSLYRGGLYFGDRELCELALRAFDGTAFGRLDDDGCWIDVEPDIRSNHYNPTSTHAAGLLYELTGRSEYLDLTKRSLGYENNQTYPDMSLVETADFRFRYRQYVTAEALAAYSRFPEGRRYGRRSLEKFAEHVEARQDIQMSSLVLEMPYVADLIRYGKDGDEEPIHPESDRLSFVSSNNRIMAAKEAGWFAVLSGDLPGIDKENNYVLDPQSHLSVWHADCGLIIGGGNSKGDPAFSNFAFANEHVASKAVLNHEDRRIELLYSGGKGVISVSVMDDRKLMIEMNAEGKDCVINLPLYLRLDEMLRTQKRGEIRLGHDELVMRASEIGEWAGAGKWRISIPENSVLRWPMKPFYSYSKDAKPPECQWIGMLSMKEKKNRIVLEIV